jgi:hypothetical protein
MKPVYTSSGDFEIESVSENHWQKLKEIASDFSLYNKSSINISDWNSTNPVEVNIAGGFRGLPAAVIRVFPLHINKDKPEIRRYNSVTVTVDFQPVDNYLAKSRIHTADRDDNPYIKQFLNYEELIKKGESSSPGSALNIDNSEAVSLWFEPGKTYYKLSVSAEGLYRVTPKFIIENGIIPETFDPKTIKVLNRGAEIPVYVSGENDGRFDPGDYMVFYGDFNRGDSTYYDWYTDENIYWFTWGGSDGQRMNIVDGSPGTEPESVGFIDTLHFESEEFFFDGFDFDAISQTEFVDGERWYWRRLSPAFGLSRILNFTVSQLNINQDSIGFRFAFKGYTHSHENVSGEEHHISLSVNDNQIRDLLFSGTIDTILNVSVSAGIISEGSNTLTLESIQTETVIDGVLFDWFEVSYNRLYSAENNHISYYKQIVNGQLFRINGFDSDSIITVDINSHRLIENASIVPENGKFTLEFTDLNPGHTRYLSYGKSSLLQPESIESFEFPNLRDHNRGADYLIISHRNFENAAGEIANYRDADFVNGTEVVFVDEIYNEFSYGIKDAHAIRDFVSSTKYWSVFPEYLLLLGDASWDVKLNDIDSKNVDYVPSYGVPASDLWFTYTDGTDDIIPDMYVGRIPIKSESEFSDVIAKIRDYENTEIGSWMKHLVFLNGGVGIVEQGWIKQSSFGIGANYIWSHPFAGETVMFNKTSKAPIDYSFKNDIINEVNRGTIWLNAMGHASGLENDINFGNVNDLNNSVYPFMVSLSCNTGRFSNPKITSLSEQYLLSGGRGAIAYFGTTGWGDLFKDISLQNNLFRAVFEDTIHTLSKAIIQAKSELGTSQSDLNYVGQHTYLGDPALKLKILNGPDFGITEGDIIFADQTPSENNKTLDITVRVRNYGYSVLDSLSVQLWDITDEASPEIIGENRIFRCGFLDSVLFTWDIEGKSGERNLKVVINADNRITEYEDNFDNNEITAQIHIFSGGAIPVYPQNLTVVKTGVVTLKASLPGERFNNQTADYKVYFEIDTLPDFQNPIAQSTAVTSGNLFAEYSTDLTNINAGNNPLFWRVRSEIGGNYSPWSISSFYLSPAVSDTLTTWKQSGRGFDYGTAENTNRQNSALNLKKQPVTLQAVSAGFHTGLFSSLVLNGETINITYYDTSLSKDYYKQGIIAAEIDDVTGEILGSYQFNTYLYASHSDALETFLDTIKTGHYVLAATRDEGTRYLSAGARTAFGTIGSKYMLPNNPDSLIVGDRDSWAIIGRKGAVPGSAVELPPSQFSIISVADTIMVFPKTGAFSSPVISGAVEWDKFEIRADQMNPGQEIEYILSAFNRDSTLWKTVYSDKFSGGINEFNLSVIDADQYPKLQLSVNLINPDQIDFPGLREWSVTYKSGPELAVNAANTSIDADSLIQGDYLNVTLPVYNAGYSIADSIVVSIERVVPGGSPAAVIPDIIINTIQPDSSYVMDIAVPTSDFTGYNELYIEVDPGNLVNEAYKGNNIVIIPVTVIPDENAPEISFLVDGRTIQNGDYVSGEAEFEINITENTETMVKDTSQIHMSINYGSISLPIALLDNPDVQMDKDINSSSTRINYSPQLESGDYTLSIHVADAHGNSIESSLTFKIESELRIERFFPYPNPFANRTTFTYILSQDADETILKIYTVRGRLIRTYDYLPTSAGFNTFEWDGRDQDGDNVANGTYLVRITAKRAGESSSSLTKSVRIR